MGEGQREREREREEDAESETGSRLRSVSTEPDVGLKLTDCEIMPEPKLVAYPTEPPRHPYLFPS